MSITLIVAILFTLAALASLFARKRRNWWLLTLLFVIGAAINWLRYFEIFR
jgi:hypothetical protein